MQPWADIKVNEIAKQKNDIQILAITFEELIAKEACTKQACCHASSYQVYKLPANEKLTNLPLNCNTDEGFPNILKHLSNLFYSPENSRLGWNFISKKT